MTQDNEQQWSFFWAAPNSDYENVLAEEREFRRKTFIRQVLLARLLVDSSDENLPQAS